MLELVVLAVVLVLAALALVFGLLLSLLSLLRIITLPLLSLLVRRCSLYINHPWLVLIEAVAVMVNYIPCVDNSRDPQHYIQNEVD